MAKEFKLPDLGEGILEGEVLAVRVSVGQAVREGDIILEVETDKAAVEIPTPYSGTVLEIRVKAGDTVKVGQVLMDGRSTRDRSRTPARRKHTPVEMDVKWQIRPKHITDFARIDSDMHFQYWRVYRKRPEAEGDIADVMSSVGACFFMPRDRFFALGCLDENHGSWGQFGTEVSCKSWLSGGRQVVKKRTWFAHLFRTKSGNEWGFPYRLSGEAQERARVYSRDIWLNGKWSQQARPLRWLIDKFYSCEEYESNPDARRLVGDYTVQSQPDNRETEADHRSE